MQIAPRIRKGYVRPWTSLPRIDWSHPLTVGLVFYGYDTGIQVIDLVRGRIPAQNSGGASPVPGTSPFGSSLSYSVDGFCFPSDASIQITPPWCAACALRSTGTQTSFARPFNRTANDNVSSPFINWGFLYNPGGAGNNVVQAAVNNGGSFAGSANWTGAANEVFTSLVQNATSSSVFDFYAQGAFQNTTTGLTIQSLNTQDNVIFSGGALSIIQQQFIGNVYYGAFWKRSLSASEIFQLHNDPYCFLIYPEDDIFATTVGVITSGVIPPGKSVLGLPIQSPTPSQTWLWRQTGMIGKDRLPNRQQDWPLPILAPDIFRTWTFRQTGMLGQDKLPFRQQYWPNPTQPPLIDQFIGWMQTDMLGQDRLPFRQQDWPNPTPPPGPMTWTWTQTDMIGQDQLPNRQQDWPNPTPPPEPGRTWLWSQTKMVGQDRLPFRQQDWPLPTPPPEPGRTWLWSQTRMQGQDILPFRQQDWPNPVQPPRLDYTWVKGVVSVTVSPFRQQDWPNPTQLPFFDRTWLGQGVITVPINPFVQTDWPNPVSSPYFDRFWSFNFALRTPVGPMPFRQQDWPLPVQPARIDQTWAWSQTRQFGQDRLPNRQQDWPNATPPPFFDRTWVQGFNPLLATAVVVFPFRQMDWPLPTQAPQIDQFWGWRQTRQLGQDQLPNRQQDWPLSALHSLPRIEQTVAWRQTRMLGQDVLPNRQQDWPLPALHTLPRIDPAYVQGFTVVLLGQFIQPRVPYQNADNSLPLGYQLLINLYQATLYPTGWPTGPFPPPQPPTPPGDYTVSGREVIDLFPTTGGVVYTQPGHQQLITRRTN